MVSNRTIPQGAVAKALDACVHTRNEVDLTECRLDPGRDFDRDVVRKICEREASLVGTPYEMGQRIDPGYQLEYLIRAGDLVNVAVARAPSGKPVLIKFLREERYASLGMDLFRHSMELSAGLPTTFFQEQYQHGFCGSLPYVAYEFVYGASLDVILEKFPQGLPTKAVFAIAGQLCDGLSILHEREIVHRDIKPSNIVVAPGGDCKIIDYDLFWSPRLKDFVQGDTPGACGTYRFMSSDHFDEDTIDARADIYSLGCTLFKLATNQLPYDYDTPGEIIEAHREEPTPHASNLRKGIPEGLDAIIYKAMSKDRNDRYQSVMEMKDALTSVMASSSMRIPLLSMLSFPRSWSEIRLFPRQAQS